LKSDSRSNAEIDQLDAVHLGDVRIVTDAAQGEGRGQPAEIAPDAAEPRTERPPAEPGPMAAIPDARARRWFFWTGMCEAR
jgi:hypothetical protein